MLTKMQEKNEGAKLTQGQLESTMFQLADGLVSMKEHRIVHGDLNSSNLLVLHETESDLTIAITDFGTSIDLSKTRAISVKELTPGTLIYWSPEKMFLYRLHAKVKQKKFAELLEVKKKNPKILIKIVKEYLNKHPEEKQRYLSEASQSTRKSFINKIKTNPNTIKLNRLKSTQIDKLLNAIATEEAEGYIKPLTDAFIQRDVYASDMWALGLVCSSLSKGTGNAPITTLSNEIIEKTLNELKNWQVSKTLGDAEVEKLLFSRSRIGGQLMRDIEEFVSGYNGSCASIIKAMLKANPKDRLTAEQFKDKMQELFLHKIAI